MALERDVEEDVPDLLQPKDEYMTGRAKRELLRFRDATLGADWDEVAAALPLKKPRTKASAGAGGAAAAAIDVHLIDWAGLVETGEIAKQTVTMLKVYLRHHSQALAGKKGELVDRVIAHVEASSNGGGSGAAAAAAAASSASTGVALSSASTSTNPPNTPIGTVSRPFCARVMRYESKAHLHQIATGIGYCGYWLCWSVGWLPGLPGLTMMHRL